jgi:steroid delta-isomerase-like uncharacterized protein
MEEIMKNVSSTEANVALVRSMYAAFGRGDIAAIVAACSPDIDWEVVGAAEDFPLFGARHGSAGVEGFFRQLPEVHRFTEFSPENFAAGGDTVVALGHYSFAFNHNGRKVATEWAHAFTLRDGKVAKFREYTDSAQMVEAYRAAGDGKSSPAERNKAIIRRWVEDGWNKRNIALIDEIFAADVRQHDPNGALVTNAEELKTYVGGLMTAFPDLTFTIASLTAEADRVVCRFDSRGTHRAAFGNIPPTGKTGRVTGQLEFHFAGDKVSEVWVDYDLFGLLRQLGVLPALA